MPESIAGCAKLDFDGWIYGLVVAFVVANEFLVGLRTQNNW